MRSSLSNSLPKSPKTEEELFKLSQQMWHEQKKAIIDINELFDSPHKDWLIAICEAKYGRRKCK